VKRCILLKNLVGAGIALALLTCGAAQAQDLTKLGPFEVQAKPASQETPRAPIRSRRGQGLVFDLDGCSPKGDDLICNVTVTSEGRDRWLSVSLGSRAWNVDGEEYGPGEVIVANSRSQSNCARKQLLENVPTLLSMTFSRFSDDSEVERLSLVWAESEHCWGDWQTVDFEKIVITGRSPGD